MAYVPDPANAAQPLDSGVNGKAGDAAAEFRALKGRVNTVKATADGAAAAVATKAAAGANNDITSLVLSKNSGVGIQVDPASPTFGWRDLIGAVIPKSTGVGAPTLDTITGNLRGWRYSAGDDGDGGYHIPHDYVPGSDLYLHAHWTHNGTNISGSFVINIYVTYAKGHQQASFSAEKMLTITDGSLTIVNTPALWHRIPEVQLSTPGGSASLLDTDLIEVDGLIIVHYDVATIPTITGGSGEPFILTLDLHYQSSNLATKNKSPGFYG